MGFNQYNIGGERVLVVAFCCMANIFCLATNRVSGRRVVFCIVRSISEFICVD